jgi:hypothetical protein
MCPILCIRVWYACLFWGRGGANLAQSKSPGAAAVRWKQEQPGTAVDLQAAADERRALSLFWSFFITTFLKLF